MSGFRGLTFEKSLKAFSSNLPGENQMNDLIKEDLIRLRDELSPRAFDADGTVKNATLAEVVWKMNSCLFKGYPRREVSK